jgi:hypothetical protein
VTGDPDRAGRSPEAGLLDGAAVWLSPTGRFEACFAIFLWRFDDVQDALQWTASNGDEMPPGPAAGGEDQPPPPGGDWEYLRVARTLRIERLAVEDDVLAACEGLDVAIEEALQHEDVCTPLPLGEEPAEVVSYVRAEKALAVIARERMRRGDTRRGMELLLDGVRLGDDVARGRPAILGAMIGVAMRGIAMSQIQGLVATDLPWQTGDLEELERQALVLARTQPSFAGWVGDDLLSMLREPLERRGWRPPSELANELGPAFSSEDERDVVADARIAYAGDVLPRLAALCPPAASRADCLGAFEVEAARAQREGGGFQALLGELAPPLSHAGFMRALYREALPPMLTYLRRAATSEAQVRALPALFVHRRLALAGGCPEPSVLEAALAALPVADGFGGSFTVLPSSREFRPLEISGPAWLDPEHRPAGTVRLPLLEVFCPALPVSRPDTPTSG